MNNTSKAIISILAIILCGIGYLLYAQHQENKEYKTKIFEMMEQRKKAEATVEDAAPEPVKLVPVSSETNQPEPSHIVEPPVPTVDDGVKAKNAVAKQAAFVFQKELRKVTNDNTYKYDSIKFQGEPFNENSTLSFPVTLRFKINGTGVYYSCESAEIQYDLNNGMVEGYIPDACFIP